MAYRETYRSLQCLLKRKLSVEEAVNRLMMSARTTTTAAADEVIGSHVDATVVREILREIGLDGTA